MESRSQKIVKFFLFIIIVSILIVSNYLYYPSKVQHIDHKSLFQDVQTGDIIFRKESNFISDVFSKVDDSFYSHIGIIIKKGDNLSVYHMEANKEEKDLKVNSIDIFTKSTKYLSVYRYQESIDEEKLKKILNHYIEKNVKFDFSFSLNNNKLYCTEFINEVFFQLFDKNIYSYLMNFNNYKIISIRSIMKNRDLKKVLKVKI